jgi:hypothetical protein
MAFSHRAGWDELRRIQPRLGRIALRLALPLSLLPPAMIYFAGSYHGDAFLPGFGARPWMPIAVAFFLAEWVSIALMGLLVKAIAAAHNVRCTYRDACVLALIPPIPMWLSSLGLFSPHFLVAFTVAIGGLTFAVALIYHGIRSVHGVRDEVVAMSMTQGIAGVGLMAWALLLMVLIPA